MRVVLKDAAFLQSAEWAGSRERSCLGLEAIIGNDQPHGDVLEVDLEVVHPQIKEVNVEMTDDLEAEIEIEGERGPGAEIKEDLGQGTGSV